MPSFDFRTNDIDTEIINKLQEFLENDEFDTDSVSIDISNIGVNSNIEKYIEDTNCV